jgi:mRNA-degrading endonuclease toxin of MazEF toxin-antitoxin module
MLRYQIAQVDFPFLDENKIKSRPCLVLTKPKGKYQIVVIAYMTSSSSQIENTDVSLDITENYFKETGLVTTTIIKLHRLEHVSINSLRGKIGELSADKSQEIKQKLSSLFELIG